MIPLLLALALVAAPDAGGRVSVTVEGDQKVLWLDGARQGAAAPGASAVGDPLVTLALAARAGAKRALVLGLGTGRTVMELRARGVVVTAIEREAAVVDAAREHFGFTGAATVGDGYEALRSGDETFDLIVLDTCERAGCVPPEGLAAALRRHLAPGGLIALRGLGSPAGVPDLLRRLGQPCHAAFGGGTGDEAQNLFVLAAEWPLEVQELAGTAAWALSIPSRHGHVQVFPETWTPAGRQIDLVGYLVRYPEVGLVLDLPHEEMGAVRWVLRGEALPELERLLPQGATFPTQGDIGSDGDVGPTLHRVLGGGGVMRSEMRHSPVVVRLTGRGRLVAAVDPDAGALRLRNRISGPAAKARPLPHGGALYELEVERVIGRLDRARWAVLDRELTARLGVARKRLQAGDLPGTVAALQAAEDGLAKGLGPLGLQVPILLEVARVRRRVTEASGGLGVKAGALEVARACDRLNLPAEHVFGLLHPALESLGEAQQACAVARYEQVARGHDEKARKAAARLLTLLPEEDPRRRRLVARFGKELRPAEDPVE